MLPPSGKPSISACPPDTSSKPVSMLIAVDLPAPLGPSRPKHSPRPTASVRLSTATRLPTPARPGKTLCRSRTMMDSSPVAPATSKSSTRARSASTSASWPMPASVSLTLIASSPPGPASPSATAAARGISATSAADAFLRPRQESRKNSQWRRVPLPDAMTCSKYQPSSMNRNASTMKMPHTGSMPLPDAVKSSNCMPVVPRYTPRNAYCPISYSPRYSDHAGTHSMKKTHSWFWFMNVCRSRLPMRPDAKT
mmetsp:Transcript_40228/g.119922  ORF Transcript_40228/g.119922 Transcript_40228/m.119922 type:complete len:253 (+) Transcript_40228:1632-2390(+)|eukprot:353445-Chlamydomonas_euryale.AAC.9